ncbi:MAG: hypothetical protein IJA02_10750 [Clostridia bacterium]|nr:hypothetical protein [Clostridia bacterium]
MRYKYSKIAFVCCLIFTALIVMTILFTLGFFIDVEKKQFNNVILLVSAFLISCAFMYGGEYFNKYITLSDEQMFFNSFRFKGKIHPISFNVKYVDVWSVTSRTLPLLGIWAIKIKAKNLPHEITISFCFQKHRKLYSCLCALIKERNDTVYIDSHLEKFILQNRHQSEEGSMIDPDKH